MLKCILCGEFLADQDAFVKGSISGEVYEYQKGSVHPTGQKCVWEGVRFCPKHFTEISDRIEDNLAAIEKKRNALDNGL